MYREHLYVVSGTGVLTVFDAATGVQAYKRGIGEIGCACSASPIAADGRIYLTSEDEAVGWNGAGCIGLYLSRRGAASVGDFWFEVDEITFFGADVRNRIDTGISRDRTPPAC